MPRSTLLFIAAGLAWAQASPSAFEAASLKQVPDNEVAPLSVSPRRTGAKFAWSSDLSSMMRYAYRLPRSRISGIDYPRVFFTVAATMDPAATEDQARTMLKSLLADRFKIAAHYETKELQGYALVVAKNGPKLQTAAPSGEPPPMPEYRKNAPSKAFEGRIFTEAWAPGVSALMGRGVTMSQLADELSEDIGELVLDRTALTSKYYFGFQFASIMRPVENADAPAVFSAIQNELGLRLEKQKAPVEILVVDRYEKTPSGD